MKITIDTNLYHANVFNNQYWCGIATDKGKQTISGRFLLCKLFLQTKIKG